MNSNRKGKRGELLWRNELLAQGYGARRGQQFAGGAESPDVICPSLPDLHFEVKAVENLSIHAAMEQAVRDAGTSAPVVAHKRNRNGWLVTMRSQDWFALLKGKLGSESGRKK